MDQLGLDKEVTEARRSQKCWSSHTLATKSDWLHQGIQNQIY